jgi:hypothetical protein
LLVLKALILVAMAPLNQSSPDCLLQVLIGLTMLLMTMLKMKCYRCHSTQHDNQMSAYLLVFAMNVGKDDAVMNWMNCRNHGEGILQDVVKVQSHLLLQVNVHLYSLRHYFLQQ